MPRTDYADWNKEELIEHIRQLEKRKKYGLVWDEERTKEQFEAEAENSLPVLVEAPDLTIETDPDQPTHILIEGDNYHALSVLNYTHENSVDAIYIDPPYNVGKNSWKYNNKFVNEDDAYRHSKWLSFMEKRLLLARNLLADDGIICVTIDDNEAPRLWLLLDDIFDERNFLGSVVIRINPGGRKSKRKIALQHEHAFFYAKSLDTEVAKTFIDPDNKSHNYQMDMNGWYEERNLRKEGQDSLAKPDSDRYYPIWYDPETGQVSAENKLTMEILPIDTKGEKRIWRRGKSDIEKLYEDGDIFYKRTSYGDQIYFKFRGGIKGETPKSFWDNPLYSASEHGTQILDNILGEREAFPFPKSYHAVAQCIKVATSKSDAVILDFFAGSGTTAQAILELNQEDGGNRQCILVTNNENNIMTEVCYPRVQRVMQGYDFDGKDKKLLYERKVNLTQMRRGDEIYAEYQQARDENSELYDELKGEFRDNTIRLWGFTDIEGRKEGLGSNLKYYRTGFVPAEPTDENKEILTYHSVEMLCLRENTFDFVTETDIWKIYENQQQYTGILFDQLSISEFKKTLDILEAKPVSVYVFSLGDDNFALEFEDMGERVKVCSIPEAILKVYRRIYQ